MSSRLRLVCAAQKILISKPLLSSAGSRCAGPESSRSLHAHGTSFHWLKFLDSAAPIGLGHIDIAFGIDCQSVAVGKFTDLVTRPPEA
jgi:hypothetical protein